MRAAEDPSCDTSDLHPQSFHDVPMTAMQTTLRKALRFHGTGLHTGLASTLTLHPAPAGTGLQFVSAGHSIPAIFENVVDSRLCTTLASPSTPSTALARVEHLLAALSAAAVDNVRAEVSCPELPIMDGSAAPFSAALVGNVAPLPNAPRRRVIVKRRVAVRASDMLGERSALIMPHEDQMSAGLRLDVTTILRGLGPQRVAFEVGEESFRTRIARARTFCFRTEVERMRAVGLAKGGTLDNAVVLDDNGRVLNEDGWRFADEVCRHSLLDCIGDLRLGGCLVGEFISVRPAHALTLELLRKLYRNPDNYCIE